MEKLTFQQYKKLSTGYTSYSKYKNKKTEYNGVTYDSKREASRRAELDVLLRAGKIRDLQIQVRIPCMINNIKVFTYVADFVYFDVEKNTNIIEDVKSSFTSKMAVYRLKKKILEAQGYFINEVF